MGSKKVEIYSKFIKSKKQSIVNELKKDIEQLNMFYSKSNIKMPDIESFIQNQVSNYSSIISDKNIADVPSYIEKRNHLSDLNFFESIRPLISEIKDSNGSRYYKKKNLNVAIVTDEFMFNFYKDAANFFYLSNTNYKEVLEKVKIDLFMFVTGWQGMNNKDWYGIASSEDKKLELINVIDYVKSLGIPTIFQSIEDPSNYQYFVDFAKRCDYIFTTAKEKVNDYKKDCNNDNVWVLEFGINPLFHNPIGFRMHKINSVFFAGSWTNRYKERCLDMEKIFDGVIEGNSSLKIIDRNFELNNKNYFFPEKYLPYISPSINHSDLQKVHKLFDWAVNLNSIKYSETMCAMRVFELQALGNIVLSNYSIAVNNKFPNIFIINDKDEVQYILNSYSKEELYMHQVSGIRNVMSNNTVFERFNYILKKCKIDDNKIERKVLVLVDEITPKITEMFNQQTYLNKEILPITELDNNKYINYDIVTFFNSSMEYNEFYLEDMINAFKYTDCDYITKDCYYSGKELINGVEHDYVSRIKNKYATVFWRESFSLNEIINMDKTCYRENGYSIDRFEFNEFSIKNQFEQKDYKISVIVPIYNNGLHLENKCFKSLKRSSIFENMEIILVDDGSTDNITPMIINRLSRQYSNIRTYFFNDNGSGSASRPRNKGVELATSRYVTFLDPDNEAVNDGYAKLYNEIKDDNVDMVVGNIKKVSDIEGVLKFDSPKIINEPKKHLINSNFRVQSVQALLVKKELLVANEIDSVVGAIGEDTLFFQELMLTAKKVKYLDLVIHIYYAAVSNSTVNTINRKFFEKSYLLEKNAVVKYKKYGILEEYKIRKFEHFYKYWYLKKLENVNKDDFEIAIDILYKIYKLYEDDLVLKDEQCKRFVSYYEKNNIEKLQKEYQKL